MRSEVTPRMLRSGALENVKTKAKAKDKGRRLKVRV
jgi:hypothetical protein